jgi:predicted PhzF superfamily epimerase YddE/YHI9
MPFLSSCCSRPALRSPALRCCCSKPVCAMQCRPLPLPLLPSQVPACPLAPAGSSSAPLVLSRFFGPWLGIPEDHVTGSAHAVLGPHFAARLGKRGFWARQCSARGGDVRVQVDWEAGRVLVAGDAVLVLCGTMSC